MREGSFLAALMPFRCSNFGSSGPFRGDRAREREGAVLGDIARGVDRRCHYLRGRVDLCTQESADLQSQICDWVASAGWWRCASSVPNESTELAATKRAAEPSIHRNWHHPSYIHLIAYRCSRVGLYSLLRAPPWLLPTRWNWRCET